MGVLNAWSHTTCEGPLQATLRQLYRQILHACYSSYVLAR